MIDLTREQCDSVSGGWLMQVMGVAYFLTQGGYRAAIDFTSGAIEGFVEAGK